MEIRKIANLENEEDRVKALYNIFDEESRLKSKAIRVEFLTTVRQIEKYLRKGMKILDLGAGAGEYSLYFADKGYAVTAVELVDHHVDKIKEKKKDDMELVAFQGTALDLSKFEDKSFDIISCFGPLYHLVEEQDALKCISEVKRVCKDSGFMFFAFINNDMVILTERMCYNNSLKADYYNHDTFKVKDFPFVFKTVDKAREILNKGGAQVIKEIASDGLSELLEDKINSMDDEEYKLWLNYHFYCCEKPEYLGTSNHLLFIAKK